MIEENPAFGYRTVAHLLGFNQNTVQRIFQLKGWAGTQAPGGLAAAHPGLAIGGQGAR
jgi:putative transposase